MQDIVTLTTLHNCWRPQQIWDENLLVLAYTMKSVYKLLPAFLKLVTHGFSTIHNNESQSLFHMAEITHKLATHPLLQDTSVTCLTMAMESPHVHLTTACVQKQLHVYIDHAHFEPRLQQTWWLQI